MNHGMAVLCRCACGHEEWVPVGWRVRITTDAWGMCITHELVPPTPA